MMVKLSHQEIIDSFAKNAAAMEVKFKKIWARPSFEKYKTVEKNMAVMIVGSTVRGMQTSNPQKIHYIEAFIEHSKPYWNLFEADSYTDEAFISLAPILSGLIPFTVTDEMIRSILILLSKDEKEFIWNFVRREIYYGKEYIKVEKPSKLKMIR